MCVVGQVYNYFFRYTSDFKIVLNSNATQSI